MKRALDGVKIISPRATASDLTLLSSRRSLLDCTKKSVETLLERIHGNTDYRGGLHFVRTIAPDDWVLNKLIAGVGATQDRRRPSSRPRRSPDFTSQRTL